MLGLRGCRLGLMIPDFVKVQTRAILNAPDRGREGRRPPEGQDHDPARRARERAGGDEGRSSRPRPRRSRRRPAVEVDYKFGTMIEVPRGALTADEIARARRVLQLRHERPDPDDVRLQPRRRRGRLPAQVRRGRDPAVQPVPDARRRGRGPHEDRRRQGPGDPPDLELGICGEHGGDPESIHKCERIGLDYVSCSPFRVPVARLAAAQAVLAGAERDK